MKENKKKLGVIVVSLILMIGLVIGLTYAAFTYTSSGTQENIVSTTAVTMKYTEKTNGILLENAMPTSDEVGKTLALDSNYAFYFTVSITTGNNTPIGYEVTAEKLTAKELFDKNLTDEDKEADVELVKDDEVRLYLERSENNPDNYQSIMEPTIYTPLTTSTPLGAQVGEMMLDFGTVSETKTYHYILRMWIGENYEVDNIERYYGVRVNVYGTDSRSYSNTLTLNKTSLELEIDESEQLTPTISPTNVTNADITWSSSDSTIATVDRMGNVTGVKAGTATITATTSKGRKATCTVIVNGKSPQSIAIKENDATLENITLITENSKVVNASVTPNDYDDSTYSVIWTTSDSDIVDIEEVTEGTTGTSSDDETIIASKMASKNITAKKVKLVAGSTPGEATITATTKNKEGKDVSTSFTVMVEYPNANSVTLDTTKATMDIGDSTTLTVTINPTNVKNDEIVWTSNNSSVIDVSSCSGKSCTVEGISEGEASITTTIKDTDISDTSTIMVQKPEITKIDMSSDISTYKGKTATFTLNITPSEVRNQDKIRWKSDDTAVATIPDSCSGSLSCSVNAVWSGNVVSSATIKAVVVNIVDEEEVETTIYDTATITVNPNRDTSGANEPELRGEMVPVRYDTTKSAWVKADKYDWYDYDSLEWANAVTLTSTGKNTTYNIGDTIPSNVINAYWVWIPRYSYTIKCDSENTNCYGHTLDSTGSTPSLETPGAIDVKFEEGTSSSSDGIGLYTGDTISGYYTPLGFTFDNKDLKGVWISKFELTGDTTHPTSVPGVTSLRSQSVKSFYTTIQTYMNGTNGSTTYGLSGNYDTHMSKNSEWSLMGYLSQSKYGKYGNSSYSNANKEIYQNKSSDYITGCSSGAPYASGIGTAGCTNTYTTKAGQGASTTGNIYGIYDTSGGTWEFVMAAKETNTSGFSTSEFNALSPKYLDLFSSYDVTIACSGSVCRGQNLNTTNGWYGRSVQFVHSGEPWLFRSGWGIFSNGNNAGAGVNNVSTRISLSAY